MSAIQIKSAQILRLAALAQDDRLGIAKANESLPGSRLHHIFDSHPHPYRMRLQIKGLSHGLKKCPPDTFLPRFARPSFRVPKTKKERTPEGVRSGTPEGTRTPDLLIRSQSLYPTELPAHVQSRLPAYINTAIRKCQALFFKFLKIFLSVDRGWSAW